MKEESGKIEFDWDAENTRHLNRYRVTPKEFEEVLTGDPLYLEYQTREGEERYKVLGVTKNGRVLIGIWTSREGKIRAVTAYEPSRGYRELYWKVHE